MLERLMHKAACWVKGYHEIDWRTVHECGIRQCTHCRNPMGD